MAFLTRLMFYFTGVEAFTIHPSKENDFLNSCIFMFTSALYCDHVTLDRCCSEFLCSQQTSKNTAMSSLRAQHSYAMLKQFSFAAEVGQLHCRSYIVHQAGCTLAAHSCNVTFSL